MNNTSSIENCLSPTSSLRKSLLLKFEFFLFRQQLFGLDQFPSTHVLSSFKAYLTLSNAKSRTCRNLHAEIYDTFGFAPYKIFFLDSVLVKERFFRNAPYAIWLTRFSYVALTWHMTVYIIYFFHFFTPSTCVIKCHIIMQFKN